MRAVRLIIVTGLPGSGKTTVARSLATRYRMTLIEKDAIKEPLLDALGAGDRAHSRRLSDASFAVMFAIARELLSAGVDFILEGNFRPDEHGTALQTALRPGSGSARRAPRIAQVLCRVQERERLARLAARHADPRRHPGHRDRQLSHDTTSGSADFLAELPGARLFLDGAARRDRSELFSALDGWLRAAARR